jgi:hypothetical protein
VLIRDQTADDAAPVRRVLTAAFGDCVGLRDPAT